jgi:hypothetical protein
MIVRSGIGWQADLEAFDAGEAQPGVGLGQGGQCPRVKGAPARHRTGCNGQRANP